MDACEIHFGQNQQRLLMNWMLKKNVKWLDGDALCCQVDSKGRIVFGSDRNKMFHPGHSKLG